jgi:outer membrane protein
MKRIIVLAIFCSLVSLPGVFSQESHFAIQYDMGFGTGDLGEFISKPSFRGASAQYRYAVTEQILVGVDVAWNVFYEEKEYDSYTAGTMTLSGKQYRYQNQVPLLVSADYIFTRDNAVKPYAGLGLGTMYSERATDMGTWRLLENPWHFALKPEIGLMYDMSPGTAFKLSARYYTGFGSGDLETQSYFTISAGFAFKF